MCGCLCRSLCGCRLSGSVIDPRHGSGSIERHRRNIRRTRYSRGIRLGGSVIDPRHGSGSIKRHRRYRRRFRYIRGSCLCGSAVHHRHGSGSIEWHRRDIRRTRYSRSRIGGSGNILFLIRRSCSHGRMRSDIIILCSCYLCKRHIGIPTFQNCTMDVSSFISSDTCASPFTTGRIIAAASAAVL